MSVTDHGLEAIRKSAVEVTPGDRSEYKLNISSPSLDSVDAKLPSGLTVVGGKLQVEAAVTPAAGGSTSALQTTGNTSLSSIDTKTPALGQALASASTPVVLTSAQVTALTAPTTVTVIQSTGSSLHVAVDSLPSIPTGSNAIGTVSVSNLPATQPVSAASLPLPTGAATETTLSSLNTKVPSGLTIKAASTAALATDQALVVTISPNNPITLSGEVEIKNDSGNPVPVNGTITANIGSTNGLALDASVNLLLKPASTLAAVTTIGSITNTVTIKSDTAANQANALKVDGSATTQPVSVVTLPLPSGAATSALQTTGNASLSSIDSKLTSPLTVTGALTDVQLRATAVPVSGTVTANAGTGTFAVSAVSLPLPSGSATSAKQDTGNVSLASIDTKTPALGQTTMLASTPVVIASNQSALPVSGIFFQATQPVSGAFFQATQPVSIASMPSTPVTGTFFQATQPISGTVTANAGTGTMAVSAAALPLPSGASTETTLASLLTSSQLIDDGVGTVGLASTTKGMAALGHDGTNARILKTDASGELQIDVLTMPTTTVTGTVSVNALPTGTNNIGDVDVLTMPTVTINSIPAGINNIGDVDVLTMPTVTINAIPAGTNRIGSVRLVDSADVDLTTTKNTQSARAVGTQDLKDAGRNPTNHFMSIQILSTVTDTLISLTGYKSGAAVTATTTPAVVSAGKTYRITNITMSYTTIATTAGCSRFTLRANTAGIVAIGSPAVTNWEVGEPSGGAPVAGKKNTLTIAIADGLEFAAGTGIGISLVGLSTTGAAGAAGYGRISILGYEY